MDLNSVQVPDLYGNDPDAIMQVDDADCGSFEAEQQKAQRDRRAREAEEDSAFLSAEEKQRQVQELEKAHEDDLKGKGTIRGSKDRRFKIYLKYEGRKGPPMFIKCRFPKHGAFEEGPSLAIKKLFVQKYNSLREMLSVYSCHLRNQMGIAIPDEDALIAYCARGSVVNIVDGSSPCKPAENIVKAWGRNCLTPTTGSGPSSMLNFSRKRVKSMSVGSEFAIILTEGGRCFGFGSNDCGQLGTGDETPHTLPIDVELPTETVVRTISCGPDYTLAVSNRSEIWSWGRYQPSNWPRLFTESWCNAKPGEDGLKGVKVASVGAGSIHCSALSKDGKLYTWGYNDRGALGWGKSGKDMSGQTRPQQLKGPLEDLKIDEMVCGENHTLCRVGGDIFAWGDNASGQLGLPDRGVIAVPTLIPLPYKVKGIATGAQGTMLLDAQDGRVHFLGVYRAQAPDVGGDTEDGGGGGPLTAMLNPESWTDELQNVKMMAMGDCHGLFSDGTVIKGFGYNSAMQATGKVSKELYETDRLPVNMDDETPPHDVKFIHARAAQSYAIIAPKPGVQGYAAVRG